MEGQGGTCLCMLVELFDCLLLPAVQLPCHAMPAKLCSKWSLCLPPLSPSLPFFTCEQDAEAVDALHATAPELVAVYRQLLGQPDGVPGGCMRHACVHICSCWGSQTACMVGGPEHPGSLPWELGAARVP